MKTATLSQSSGHLTNRTSRPVAIVLAAGPNGLGAVRALHREKISSIAVVDQPTDPIRRSQIPLSCHLVPRVTESPGVLRTLLDQLSTDRPVLIPTTDVFVAFMLDNRDWLEERFDFVLPNTTTVQVLLDKERETQFMADAGVPVPRSIHRLHERPTDWFCDLRFPVIVKPRMSAFVRHLGAKNRVLQTSQDASEFSAKFGAALEYFVAQEVIPGPDDALWVCNCTFGSNHELLGAFTFQRLRLSPSHFGVTSFAESRTNPELVEHVARIGRALEYVGPAMFEFKFDARDGTYKYIEINPRLGMCNYFDTSCGVNNVAAAYRLALRQGSEVSLPKQRDGVMYLCIYEDLYARMKDGESITTIVRHYLRYMFRPRVSAYACWFDPIPGCAVAAKVVRDVGSSAWRKLVSKLSRSRV